MKIGNFYSKHRLSFYIIYFWSVLLFAAASLVFFPLQQKLFEKKHSFPTVQNGVLDLEGFTFQKGTNFPLNGTWEFYWGKWIITDPEENKVFDAHVPVPDTWNHYTFDKQALPGSGIASYRLLIKNCPRNLLISCYIPNLESAYRVYLNGTLIAQSGIPRKDFQNTGISYALERDPFHPITTSVAELVIETSACHAGGLYIAPTLAEARSNIHDTKIYMLIVAMCIGMLFLILLFNFYALSLRGLTPQFSLMTFMTLVILLRISSRGELHGILEILFPIFRTHITMYLSPIITFLLPAAFLLWAKDTVNLPVSKKLLLYTMTVDIFLCGPILWSYTNGYFTLYAWLYTLSLMPYVLEIMVLYRYIRKNLPYFLTVAASLILMLSALIMTSLHSAGLVRPYLSLYAPVVFVISLFLQMSIYFRMDKELRSQALEYATFKLSMQEKETALMLSQIKPHFLYNALIAIQVLCLKNPAQASDAIGKFSCYLRANMSSISTTQPVSFSQELTHIENYVAIEKLRFNERLLVVYDIQVKDFKIPVLTIQPLVENAIKHGICKKIRGGTVTLRTYEEETSIIIEVLDDGTGFSTERLTQSDGYGVKNISFRLRKQMGAQFTIESNPDQGTRARITLPKGGWNNECDNC